MTIKQVLVVRKDLNMRKGKIAAQCAHASMKVILDRITKNSAYPNFHIWTLAMVEHESLFQWLDGQFTKICVSVDSEDELDKIYTSAIDAQLPCAMIVDSGKTEFNGVPTKTVVAIGPEDSELIDPVTKHLKLL